ncbi:MAG: aminodeoxychorismate lyase, partial [Gammaproteobacteria bacterium]
TSGKTIAHKIRFLEGWNFKRFREELQNNPHIDHTLLFVPDKDILSILGASEGTHPEGYFFPDTYQFPNRGKDIDVLRQAYDLMQKNLEAAWAERDKSIALKTPYELLILASIIEKETALDSERRQVSGVFHRRLAKGMPLQTDPTVIYGMGDQYNGRIYKSDLRRDTPYNTYTRKGLPPTPIAMPGRASLMAAGQPDNSRALYFVADSTGGHTFSDTYQQHLQAVKVYRQQQAKAKKDP